MGDTLISCICHSVSERFALLQRAVVSFAAQDYGNKELVIAVGRSADYESLVRQFVAECVPDAASRVLVLPRYVKSRPEGLLTAMAHASGGLLTVWDDAGRSHPGRLSAQAAHAAKFPGAVSVLAESIHYFVDDDEAIVLDGALGRGEPATLFAGRREFPTPQPQHARDTYAAMLAAAAERGQLIVPCRGRPLYVACTYHEMEADYEGRRGFAQKYAAAAAGRDADADAAALAVAAENASATLSYADGSADAPVRLPASPAAGFFRPIRRRES